MKLSMLACPTCGREIAVSGSKTQPIYFCRHCGMPADDNPPYTAYFCYKCLDYKKEGHWDFDEKQEPVFLCNECYGQSDKLNANFVSHSDVNSQDGSTGVNSSVHVLHPDDNSNVKGGTQNGKTIKSS